MEYTDQQQSKALDWLRFPLVIFVVFIHSFGTDYNGSEWVGQLYNWFRTAFSHGVCRVAVPTFFLISGYYFFYRVTEFNALTYWEKLKKRSVTLLLPYLLWISIYLVATYFDTGTYQNSNLWRFFIEKGGLHIYWDSEVWNTARNNIVGLPMPSVAPYLSPMWFVRSLMVMMIAAPLLWWLMKRLHWMWVAFAALLHFTGILPPFMGFSGELLFYFSLGAWMSINGRNILNDFYRFRFPALGLFIVLLIPIIRYNGPITDIGFMICPFFVFAGVVTTVNLAAWLVCKRQVRECKALSQSTFFVYACHPVLILKYASQYIGYIIPGNGLITLTVQYLIEPLMIVLVCLCVYFILKRVAPPVLSLLTGNR